jgi:hypothetical protein
MTLQYIEELLHAMLFRLHIVVGPHVLIDVISLNFIP